MTIYRGNGGARWGEWLASRPGYFIPSPHWIGGWVDPRTDLDVLEKGKTLHTEVWKRKNGKTNTPRMNEIKKIEVGGGGGGSTRPLLRWVEVQLCKMCVPWEPYGSHHWLKYMDKQERQCTHYVTLRRVHETTDMTKLRVTFRNFANAPKNKVWWQVY